MWEVDSKELVVDLGVEGERIRGLKGGEGLVYGRGGEEGEVLGRNDI